MGKLQTVKVETKWAQRKNAQALDKHVRWLRHLIRQQGDKLRRIVRNGNQKAYRKWRQIRDDNVVRLEIHSAVLADKLGQRPRSVLKRAPLAQ